MSEGPHPSEPGTTPAAPGAPEGRTPFSLVSVASTAAVWLSLAALVLYLRHAPARSLFESAYAYAAQALAGFAAGAGLAAAQLLLLRGWSPWRAFTIEAVRDLRLTAAQGFLVALTVSVAEELFFRAALQPVAGLWLTSALFAFGHARYDRESWARGYRALGVVAPLMLFGTSVALGAVYARFGLAAAMVCHFVYDAVVLEAYRRLRPAAADPAGRAE